MDTIAKQDVSQNIPVTYSKALFKHFTNSKLPPLSRIRDYINDIIFIFILWAEVAMIAPQVSYILIDNHI